MSASSYRLDGHQRHSLEFRWTMATAVALACCTAALIAAIASFATGERFEYRPDPSSLTRYGGEPADRLKASQIPEAARMGAFPGSVADRQAPGAASAETSGDSVAPGLTSQCSGGTWPYFTGDCLWAADIPKRPRVTLRLKSPWCSGVLRHQPFYGCRPRPK